MDTLTSLAHDIAAMLVSKGVIDPIYYTSDELSLLFELFEQVRNNVWVRCD